MDPQQDHDKANLLSIATIIKIDILSSWTKGWNLANTMIGSKLCLLDVAINQIRFINKPRTRIFKFELN